MKIHLFPLLFRFLFTTGTVILGFANVSLGIMGGTEVMNTDKILMATVGIFDSSNKSICTGTLLANDLVLTAAHCIGKDPAKMVVVFGVDFKKTPKKNIRRVLMTKTHPSFEPPRGQEYYVNTADIGLIRIDISEGLPAGYFPIKILTNIYLLEKHTRIVVAGFGKANLQDSDTGAGILRTTTMEVYEPNFSKTEVLFYQENTQTPLTGDSGGPLYLEVNGQLYVWGIVSRGDQDSKLAKGFFSIVTRIDPYRSWLLETTHTLRK